jgi:hypothetical protein
MLVHRFVEGFTNSSHCLYCDKSFKEIMQTNDIEKLYEADTDLSEIPGVSFQFQLMIRYGLPCISEEELAIKLLLE